MVNINITGIVLEDSRVRGAKDSSEIPQNYTTDGQ